MNRMIAATMNLEGFTMAKDSRSPLTPTLYFGENKSREDVMGGEIRA
jgi:hypothetical protein